MTTNELARQLLADSDAELCRCEAEPDLCGHHRLAAARWNPGLRHDWAFAIAKARAGGRPPILIGGRES